MKRKLLATFSISLCLLLSSCGNGISNTMQQITSKEDSGQIEIELSMDNISDYIDFASIGKTDNDTYNWIMVNKQYENDMVYIKDDFEIFYELTSYITVENNKQEKRIGNSNSLTFADIIESIDKPIITDVSGTITLYKGGKAYFDDDSKQRIVEYGNHKKETRNNRTDYFNEYPY